MTLLPNFGEFEYAKADLETRTKKYLNEVLKVIGQPKSISCAGHTDVGPKAPDYLLGLERAETVCNYLHSHGVRSRMETTSFGFSMLREPEGTAYALRLNRFVTITVRY